MSMFDRFTTPDSRFSVEIVEELLERLRDGESMRSICACKGMPSRETVRLWSEEDDDLGLAITRATETGWEDRAERAVDAAKKCRDPQKGRLAFDAERWFLGKRSKLFADKPVTIVGDPNRPVEHKHNVDADAFAQLAAIIDGIVPGGAGLTLSESAVAEDGAT